MSCIETQQLIALVDGELPVQAQAELESHVASCAGCAAVMADLVALAPTHEDGEPHRLGRFQLHRVLGQGAMGIVWKAWDLELERMVAVKLVHAEHGAARLIREAKALARVSHPNVVVIYDAGEIEGEVFIATELVEGETLAAWTIAEHTWKEIVGAWAQAARGLAAVHARDLVHRDVKPSNVLVSGDGRVRVGDFGLARDDSSRATTADERWRVSSPVVTAEGAIAGTPAYMAPEQRTGEALDGRCDQFGLCVALVEALTGTRPAADSAPVLRGMPRALERAMQRGLNRDREARFATMDELARVLERTIRPRSRAWLVAAAVSVVAVVSAGAVRLHEAPATCDAEPELRSVWGPIARTAIHAAYAPSERVDHLVTTIDAWGAAWISTANASCRATRGGQQSVQLQDLRAACLHHELDVATTQIALARRGDTAVIGEPRPLPQLEDCNDADALMHLAPLPPPGLQRTTIELTRQRLAVVDTELLAHRYTRAAAEARSLATAAERLQYVPLVTETEHALGEAELGLSHDSAATAALWKTIGSDLGRGDWLVARSWLQLAGLAVVRAPDQAFGMAGVAAELIDRWSLPARSRANLEETLGSIYARTGHLDLAHVRFADARRGFVANGDELGETEATLDELELDTAAGRLPELGQIRTLVEIAGRHPRDGRVARVLADAIALVVHRDAKLAQDVIALLEKLAPDEQADPAVAVYRHYMLGVLATGRDDKPGVYRELCAALAIGKRAQISDGLLYDLATPCASMAWLLGDNQIAIDDATYALDLATKDPAVATGGLSPTTLRVYRAGALAALDQLAKAREDAERAVSELERMPNADADDLASAHEMLAQILWSQGAREHGRSIMDKAIRERTALGQSDQAHADRDALK